MSSPDTRPTPIRGMAAVRPPILRTSPPQAIPRPNPAREALAGLIRAQDEQARATVDFDVRMMHAEAELVDLRASTTGEAKRSRRVVRVAEAQTESVRLLCASVTNLAVSNARLQRSRDTLIVVLALIALAATLAKACS